MTSSRLWQWLALAGIVAMAAVVRCHRLDMPILSHDEAFSWRLTQYPVAELMARTGQDVHPPLYYLLLKIWVEAFGDSLWALRGLSVVFGIAAVLVMYAVVVEALRWHGGTADVTGPSRRGAAASPTVVCSGALLVGLLAALASGQVDASRNARMYGLGVLLAGTSAWLLLRACRADRGRWMWWAAYGMSAALFCYTHNYAFFTLLGQGLFVAGLVVWPRSRAFVGEAARFAVIGPNEAGRFVNDRARILFGFGYAALLAVILYLPWLPVLLEQMRQVRESFWMEQVDGRIVETTLFTWSTGLAYEGEWVSRIWLAMTAVAAGFALWRRTKAAAFFLLQAFCPWLLAVGLSLASGRSIFHDHLLVFAQFSLIGFWAVVWTALPGWPERLAFALVLVSTALTGLATSVANIARQPPAIVEAAAFLEESAQPGDEVWTGSAWELNQLRYYLAQAGADDLKVRCRHSFPGKGHTVHIASITAEEVIWTEGKTEQLPRRLWLTANQHGLTQPMDLVVEREFGVGHPRFVLRLMQRKTP